MGLIERLHFCNLYCIWKCKCQMLDGQRNGLDFISGVYLINPCQLLFFFKKKFWVFKFKRKRKNWCLYLFENVEGSWRKGCLESDFCSECLIEDFPDVLFNFMRTKMELPSMNSQSYQGLCWILKDQKLNSASPIEND